MCLQKILGANGWDLPPAPSGQKKKRWKSSEITSSSHHLADQQTHQMIACSVELDVPTCVVESEIYFLLFSILNWSHHLWTAITWPIGKKSHFGNLAGEGVLPAKESTIYCRGGISLYFYNGNGIKTSKNKKESDNFQMICYCSNLNCMLPLKVHSLLSWIMSLNWEAHPKIYWFST